MTKTIARIIAAALVAAAAFSCKEINRQSSPVMLVVTTDQTLHRLDIKPGALNCDQNIATVLIKALLIQNTSGTLPTNPDLDVVKITQYRVSYVRTDGGTSVPAPFTRSISITITPGGGGETTTFIGFQPDALSQAPFAALLPQNGGRDPQTGRPVVQMDLILEVFGETLAGDRVSGSTRAALDFCYDCNGCS